MQGGFTRALPGLDLDRLTRAFSLYAVETTGPLRARRLAGGKSNLTYEVADDRSSWVVRRPPLGHMLATAHDMSREFTVMSALRDTSVPVPGMVAYCKDPNVLGAPFYVMEHVVGTPYRTAAELEPLGPERTAVISTRMIETLAALHQVEPANVGLAGFGRPEGFLTRQVRRWHKQLDGSRSRDLLHADELFALLEAADMPEQPPGIVHGDYRLDNLLVKGDEVRAVIDWEMATIGDPVTDLALLLVYLRLASTPGGSSVADASLAPGFLDADAMLGAYVAAGGRQPDGISFYLGLAYFKLAVILEGIHYRYMNGQTVGEGFDTVGDVVEPLLAAGLKQMQDHR